MKIFTIGASGMVGSRITELLAHKHTFDDLSLTSGIDITDPKSLDAIRNDTEHDAVIHLAAKADVDGCEADKSLGKEGAAYKINVVGTKNVLEACIPTKKKFIYISTDFVFDGNDTPKGGYTEESMPHPLSWYGETKYLGEEIVKAAEIPTLIVRIAFPYRKEFELKKDFVRAIAERLRNNLPIAAITDQIITPTFIDDLAYGLDGLIELNEKGLYHVVGSESLSPFEAAMKIAAAFDLDTSLITKTTGAEFFKDRAPRPFNLALNNAKIEKLGITMRTFSEGLAQLK